jgi:hypothetical protein
MSVYAKGTVYEQTFKTSSVVRGMHIMKTLFAAFLLPNLWPSPIHHSELISNTTNHHE